MVCLLELSSAQGRGACAGRGARYEGAECYERWWDSGGSDEQHMAMTEPSRVAARDVISNRRIEHPGLLHLHRYGTAVGFVAFDRLPNSAQCAEAEAPRESLLFFLGVGAQHQQQKIALTTLTVPRHDNTILALSYTYPKCLPSAPSSSAPTAATCSTAAQASRTPS